VVMAVMTIPLAQFFEAEHRIHSQTSEKN